MTQVVLYGRAECHLCDEARALLEAIIGEANGEISLREVDIETDDRLHALYLERIPVIEANGVIVSELVPDPAALQTALLHNSPR